MKLSAEATWRELSRVIKRIRTFVSIARIALSSVAPDALFQIFQSSGGWWLCREQCVVDVQGAETACSADNDFVTIFFPLED
jgi:hypothetical protein